MKETNSNTNIEINVNESQKEASLKERKAGALWIKKGEKGKYLSLQLELDNKKYNIIGLENRFFSEDPETKPSYTLHWTADTFSSLVSSKSETSSVSKKISSKPKKTETTVAATQEKEEDLDI